MGFVSAYVMAVMYIFCFENDVDQDQLPFFRMASGMKKMQSRSQRTPTPPPPPLPPEPQIYGSLVTIQYHAKCSNPLYYAQS